MNVLSLFDGMSCAQLALKESGIEFDNYFASEIDKFAIQVTQHNFPNTIQLGSVISVLGKDLPKIDLLCGGSPCQSFSFAGKMKGMATKCAVEILTLEHYLQLKSEGYQFEGQSYLFWEYVRLLKEVKPKYFLLENVMMSAKWQAIITEAIGVEPIKINSALVSAQQRKRLYWTNIGLEYDEVLEDWFSGIQQPGDKGVLLKDILEKEVDEKYYLSAKMMAYFKNRAANFNSGKVNIRGEEGKATTLTASMASCDISDNFIKIDTNLQLSKTQDKANCFTAGGHSGGLHSDMTLIAASRGRAPKDSSSELNTEQNLEPCFDGKTNTLTSVQKANYVVYREGYEQDSRAYFENGKSGTLDVKPMRQKVLLNNYKIRRLTPTECKRLQTVPDWYDLNVVSNTQQYKMLGNGWTVSVITHIFNQIK